MKITPLLCAALALSVMAGCGSREPSAADEPARQALSASAMPPLGSGRLIEPGVRAFDVALPGAHGIGKLWIYLPASAKSGTKLPCVLIAPAGTRLFHGIGLGEGDRAEHLPYARAGFAVVAYELDGPLSEKMGDEEIKSAVNAFRASQAGLLNARDALEFALARLPIDPGRVAVAGHSSAATAALHIAEHEPRISACVAYAPATDLEKRLGEATNAIEQVSPGFRDFVVASSPLRNAAALTCPTFLFHADDDSNVPLQDNEAFAQQLQKTNTALRFVRVPSGEHYDSMIRQGIPQAILWLKSLPRR